MIPNFIKICEVIQNSKSILYICRPTLFLIFVLFYVFLCFLCTVCFVLFSVLFVCVYMCTELLPPGGYPIAVKYIISYVSTVNLLPMKMQCI